DEHAMAADRVNAENQRQLRPAPPPHEDQAPGLGLDDSALAATAAAAARPPPHLDLLAHPAIAADPLEVSARRRERARLGERPLEPLDVFLGRAAPPQVL